VLRLAGVENFDGRILLDASDPLDFSSGSPGLFVGTTDSLGERIQRLLPRAKVIKGLNTVVAEVMVNPSLTGGEPDMFIAGDSDEARQR
jgi:predicted dinucleotide-binding enzyme